MGIKQPRRGVIYKNFAKEQPTLINNLSYTQITRYAQSNTDWDRQLPVLSGSSTFDRAPSKKPGKNDKEEKKAAKKGSFRFPGSPKSWKIIKNVSGIQFNQAAKMRIGRIDANIRLPYGGGVLVSVNVQRNRKISYRTAEKIRNKAAAFFDVIPKKSRRFITLTFVDKVGHRQANKLLDNFLKQLRKEVKGMEYLWVCELQQNGNKHFHILINKHFPIFRINALWVLVQYNGGLRAKTKEGREIMYDEIITRHKKSLENAAKRNKKDIGGVGEVLNPCDVKYINDTQGVIFYITKYLTKARNQIFEGLKFHCSRGVSRLFTKMKVPDFVFEECTDPKNNFYVNKKTGEIKGPKYYINRFGFVMKIYSQRLTKKFLKFLRLVNKEIIKPFKPDKDLIENIREHIRAARTELWQFV
jgi:hypothetical protein